VTADATAIAAATETNNRRGLPAEKVFLE